MREHVSEVQGRVEYVQEFSGQTAKDVRMRMDKIIENKSVQSFLVDFSTDELVKGRRTDPETSGRGLYVERAKYRLH